MWVSESAPRCDCWKPPFGLRLMTSQSPAFMPKVRSNKDATHGMCKAGWVGGSQPCREYLFTSKHTAGHVARCGTLGINYQQVQMCKKWDSKAWGSCSFIHQHFSRSQPWCVSSPHGVQTRRKPSSAVHPCTVGVKSESWSCAGGMFTCSGVIWDDWDTWKCRRSVNVLKDKNNQMSWNVNAENISGSFDNQLIKKDLAICQRYLSLVLQRYLFKLAC